MACDSGFISIVDPFLNPDGTNWTGSITYTLLYATTVAGATIVNAEQQFNVSNGINICLAPGLYSVVLQQNGFAYRVTTAWGVPVSGGPYTVAEIQGNITLQGGAGGVLISGTPSAGQVPTATAPTTGTWQTPALLSHTVMLTQADLLALQTVPVTLVPAPGPNQIIHPTLCISEQVAATTSTANQFLQVGYGSIDSFFGIDSFGCLSGMGGTYVDSTLFFGILNGPSSNYAGQPLIGFASDAVSQPDGPSGNAYFTTYYVLFEVGS